MRAGTTAIDHDVRTFGFFHRPTRAGVCCTSGRAKFRANGDFVLVIPHGEIELDMQATSRGPNLR